MNETHVPHRLADPCEQATATAPDADRHAVAAAADNGEAFAEARIREAMCWRLCGAFLCV